MRKIVKFLLAFAIITLVSLSGNPLFAPLRATASSPNGIISPSSVTFNLPKAVENVAGTDDQASALQAPNGTIWLAWHSKRDGPSNDSIYVKTSLNSTAWKPSVRVTSLTTTSTFPSLSQFPNGTIILVWTQSVGVYDNLFYMINSNPQFAGTGWSTPTQLTNPAANDASAKTFVTADATLWLVWQRHTFSPITDQIYYRTFNKNNGWSLEAQLTTASNTVSQSPSISGSRTGVIWVAWSQNSTAGIQKIVYRTFNASSWSNTKVVTNPTTIDNYPSIVQDRDGTLWMFWSRQMFLGTGIFQYKIFYKTSSDLGNTWTSDVQLTTGGDSFRQIQDLYPVTVQATDFSLWMFYASNTFNQDYDIWYMRSTGIFPVHHIAITSITASATASPSGAYPWGDAPQPIITITVTVVNLGDYDENTLSLTVKATNSTTITVGTVLMNPIIAGASDTVTLSWDTLATNANYGRYTLTASIPRITGETIGSTVDNTLRVAKAASVLIIGALAKTPCVTIIDAGMMGRAFGSTPSSIYWNPDADLDKNGIITIIDFSILAARFGKCL